MGITYEAQKLLAELVNSWPNWDHREKYYLEVLVPRFINSPDDGSNVILGRPSLLKLQKELTSDQWQNLATLIQEHRSAVARNTARREADRQALREELRERFKRDFLSASDFYQSRCTGHISAEEYEAEKINVVKAWARQHLDRVPDPEQLAAIGAVEGNVQVVARAGSGKTATLVNRALFLQQHCGVLPNEMLLLAFNRKAADEMRERLGKKLGNETPFVMTFHALARTLVGSGKTIIEGESQKLFIRSIINDYRRANPGSRDIRALMMDYFRTEWSKPNFGEDDIDRDLYLEFYRSLPSVGLDGRQYKSYGEKAIANFLFEHDVKYAYEKRFEGGERPYHPDFAVGASGGIIIEYFGMSGSSRKYDEELEWKRDFWQRKANWHLVELYRENITAKGAASYGATLLCKLDSHCIPWVRLSEDAIWQKVQKHAIDKFTEAVKDFLLRCRKAAVTSAKLDEMVHAYACTSEVERQFINFVQTFYKLYLNRLNEEHKEDFDGLLQRAVTRIRSGETGFRREGLTGDLKNSRFVFIDEYQDFSELFYQLIEAIRIQNPQVQVFCVGDDWQAINGFAGADLRFYKNFLELFPNSRRLHVRTNYRSASSIVAAGNALMYGSGEPATAHRKENGSVTVAYINRFNPSPREKREYVWDDWTPAVIRLVSKAVMAGDEVILLSRTNHLLPFTTAPSRDRLLEQVRHNVPDEKKGMVSASTVHGYKGLQKHTVIVLDALIGKYPLIHPNFVFAQVLGDSVERIVKEERRLLYVALTRAVQRLIILTEESDCSPFLDDIRRNNRFVSDLNWADYPPTISVHKYVIVKVGNRTGSHGTLAIRDALNDEGYKWNFTGWKHWQRTIQYGGLSPEQFIRQAPWSIDANGVEIRFCDEEDNILKKYYLDGGLITE